MDALRFYCDCVSWPQDDVSADGGLSDMIGRAINVSRRTFLQHVDRDELARVERLLGYEAHPSRGLTMAGDFHVSYHRSKLHRTTVYYFKHSGIEHVFTPGAARIRPEATYLARRFA